MAAGPCAKVSSMQRETPESTPPASASSAIERVESAAALARQMWQAGSARRDILAKLATAGENLSGPGSAVSILLLDEDGLLRNGASPNLPPDYLDAIDRLKPNARVGTCAAAAATGSVVITPDFFADDKWAELRHLPHALGFVGAWSMPIKSPDGIVLGTFGTYFRDRRGPTPVEQAGVEILVQTAAMVLGAPQ